MRTMLSGPRGLLFASLALTLVKADLDVYTDDALASGWQDWSWSTVASYSATDLKLGLSSISVKSEQYAALSLKSPSVLQGFAGLSFDIAGDQPDISLSISSTTDNTQSPSIPLSAFGTKITADKFTTLLLDFNNLPPTGAVLGNGTWDRIAWQAGFNGATYHLDNIKFVTSITVTPNVLSAEPLAANLVAVTTQGAVDTSKFQVTLNGKAVTVSSRSTFVPIDTPSRSITYLNLASPLAPGTLKITTVNGTFTHVLPSSQSGSINQASSYPINPRIYGVNFPTSASYIQHLGVTFSRWGGNAVTAYNPFGGFTNAGADWYFENRANENADDWLAWVKGAGSESFLTIPALDWVAKDASSYSYPKTIYPLQSAFDPYNPDAGSGYFPNGTTLSPPPDQKNAYTPWNSTLAKKWLSGLKNKPTVVTVDNEIEIASSTHQDMHPAPVSYDEELSRVLEYAAAAKSAIPGVEVAAPSSCSWWFYWRSAVGDSDTISHNKTDFVPWFLAEMKKRDTGAGKRLLDILDLHYYYQADTSANDAAAKALRLRATRSLWDPTYVDESWIATSTGNSQPNSSKVQLIPRIQSLIAQLYPGTKFTLSEWSSTNDGDITGGLVTVDSLGIFGKYKLDGATYWATPDEKGPVGLAYWLYRGYGTRFGSSSAQVTINSFNPDKLGVYAGTEAGKNLTLVVVNKDPSSPVALNLSGVPTGTYFLRHFGGQAGVAKWQTTTTITSSSYIVVPPYTAIFLQQQSSSPPVTSTTVVTTSKPITTSSTTTSSSPSPTVKCATQWGQCGGIGWTGPTCCQASFTCTPAVNNPYYSQCL